MFHKIAVNGTTQRKGFVKNVLPSVGADMEDEDTHYT